MKTLIIIIVPFILFACSGDNHRYDATGIFETTEVIISAETSGKLLYMDVEEGMKLKAGQIVGIVDTVQLYLKKLQLEANARSVKGQIPDIRKQIAVTQEKSVKPKESVTALNDCMKPTLPIASSWMMPNQCFRYFVNNWLHKIPHCRIVIRA